MKQQLNSRTKVALSANLPLPVFMFSVISKQYKYTPPGTFCQAICSTLETYIVAMEQLNHQATAQVTTDEFIAKATNFPPLESSTKIKEKSLLKMKKMLVPKKGSKLKSKEKQVNFHESGKSGCRKRRTRTEDLYFTNAARVSVMGRLEVVLNDLGDESPSFVKCMLPSNVSHGFWLIFPKQFCSQYLPTHDSTLILVGEDEKEYEANYFVDRHGLSGGWRGFSLDHRILKGDLLVFQLIKPCTLKVHIVRVYGLDVVDAALCLMDMQRTCLGEKVKTNKKAKTSVKPLEQCDMNGYDQTEGFLEGNLVADVAKTDRTNVGSELLQGSGLKLAKKPRVTSRARKTCSSLEARSISSSPALKICQMARRILID